MRQEAYEGPDAVEVAAGLLEGDACKRDNEHLVCRAVDSTNGDLCRSKTITTDNMHCSALLMQQGHLKTQERKAECGADLTCGDGIS
jgi:hypothetical protein